MIESILESDVKPRKYIRICEGSVRVKIERGGEIYIESFPIRMNGGMSRTMKKAIQWRDKKHLELFGFPVTEKIIHIKTKRNQSIKTNPKTGEDLPLLSPGLSYGFHGGLLRYVVCSYQLNGKAMRKRFVIEGDDVNEAILMASGFRLSAMVD